MTGFDRAIALLQQVLQILSTGLLPITVCGILIVWAGYNMWFGDMPWRRGATIIGGSIAVVGGLTFAQALFS